MSGIRGKDTKPEMVIRRGLHRRGFRYRIHNRKLPGQPDLVFRRFRAVLFVNGCFWHGHSCELFRWPSTRAGFWQDKIGANMSRDRKNLAALREQAWRTGVVWECALKGPNRMEPDVILDTIADWLGSDVPELCLVGTRTDS